MGLSKGDEGPKHHCKEAFNFFFFFKSLFYALNGEAKFPGMNSKKLSFEIVLYFLFLVF